MRKLQYLALVTSLGLSLAIAPTAQAKAKITKPSAPTISAISSSAVKKGKVNVKVTITLPASNGGSKITGSKVSLGGKTCTIAKTKTSCTIKSIKNGKSLSVYANSKNMKGFGPKSARVAYIAGARAWPATPAATDTPVASAPAAALTCAAGGTCVVGDRGPGGGLVYYVNGSAGGFACGPTLAATCKYLEVAPSGWSSVSDPTKSWAVTAKVSSDIADIENFDAEAGALASSQIGLGFKNSVAIVAQGNDTSTAAGAARAYAGNSKSDWYLPTFAELTLLCQWNLGVTQNVANPCAGGSINSGTGASSAGFVAEHYWSSSEFPGASWRQNFNAAAGDQRADYKSTTYRVRPVRAF